jgi:DNA polymerase-3 subunit gamma/tau
METSQVLARKWRPRTFSELVGQEHVVRALGNALQTGRLHHAYLFTGTRGVGKTTIARILAKCLNCEAGLSATPCGVCTTCRDIDSGRFPDMLEVDAATNTKVEEMRELLDNAQYMPVSGRFKVYIIDEVHMLSRSAFNSMLKTLEEPPEHVKFILATTDPQKVPVTVLSRCLQFNLRQMPSDLITSRLQHILEQERIPCEPAALPLIARAAQGSMRDSLSLLDQAIAYGSGQVRLAEVRDMLGSIEQDYLLEILRALSVEDGGALMQVAQGMAERSLSFEQALQDLAARLHDLALLRALPGQREALGIEEALEPLAPCWDAQTLQLLYQIAVQGRKDLPLAPDEAAGFRMALLRMLAFQPAASAQSVPVSAPPKAAKPVPATPVATAPAAQARTVAGKEAPPALGDWPGLVRRLSGAGMAFELARHSELLRYAEGTLVLLLEPSHKHLMPYKEKLCTALEALLDADIRITVELGESAGESVAAVEEKARAATLQEAAEAIRSDPFVQTVVGTLGGKLVESTIKPKHEQDQGER